MEITSAQAYVLILITDMSQMSQKILYTLKYMIAFEIYVPFMYISICDLRRIGKWQIVIVPEDTDSAYGGVSGKYLCK